MRRNRIARAAGRSSLESLEGRTLLAAVDVLTWHGNDARNGLNDQETVLTPSNVNQSTFGKLFTLPVDGQMYAQPLYVSNLDMPNAGVRNVVFAATQHNSVYAFNADAAGAPLWHVNLTPPGGSTVPQTDTGVSDIVPEVGITSTPVIDAASKTMYVVARTKENGTWVQRLHALDLLTGAHKFGGPVAITAPSYHPLKQNQRPGLAIADGHVFVASASHGDVEPYAGFVLAYDMQTLQQSAVFNAAGSLSKAGIWMSGAAPAVDDEGNLYLMTGNGPFNAHTGGNSYGQSVLKLKLNDKPGGGKSLDVVDYFTPFNFQSLEVGDTDLGAGGLMLLDGAGENPDLVIGAGKQGRMYVMNQDDLGGWTAGQDDIVQTLDQLAPVYSTPAYFNGGVYYQATADQLKRFGVQGDGTLTSTWTTLGPTRMEFPGPSPVISANGTADGIVWLYQFGQQASLHAYDATTLTELYNSNQAGPRDTIGAGVKFAVPTVTNGKVYVGGASALTVFGNVNIPPTIPAAASDVTAVAAGPNRVDLTWQDNSGNETGFVIERSEDGVVYQAVGSANANITVFSDLSAAGGTEYWYRVKSLSNAGFATPSEAAQVTTPAAPFVGHWRFDEGVGGQTADASGNDAHGQIFGEVTWLNGATEGRIGKGALNFHGAGVQDAHVEMPDHPGIRFAAADDFTVLAWVNPAAFKDKWAGVVTKSADQGNGYGIYLTPDNRWAFARNSADPAPLVADGHATTGWHLVAAVQHGDGAREIWVDGVKVAEGVAGGTGGAQDADGAGELWVGGSAGTDLEFFAGAIDDVRIYDRAVGGAELLEMTATYNPAGPTLLVAEALSNKSIRLTWQEQAVNETGFVVERSTDNQQFNPVATVGAGVTEYVDTNLASSTRYHYRVAAANAAGLSSYTNVADAITQIGAARGNWRFVEGQGTTVTDASGHGNNGTLGGGVTWTEQGRVGLGLNFNGLGHVTIPNAPTLNPTGGISLSVWVKAEQWNGGTRIISKGLNDDQYNLFSAGGFLAFRVWLVGQVFTPTPSAGEWHHIAATYDNATLRLYVDGELAAQQAAFGTMLTTADPLYLGTKNPTGQISFDSFVGTMDEVYVFDRPLTEAEIDALADPVTEPDAPTNLTATPVGSASVTLTWADNSNNETGWLIERAPAGDNFNWAPVVILPPTNGLTATYSDASVEAGTGYQYRVRAQGTPEASEYSNVAPVLVPVDGDPPTVATAAHQVTPAGGAAVTGTTAELAALGADNKGEAGLTYTWSVVSGPAGAPAVSFPGGVNGTNSGKGVTAQFGRAGAYTLRVSIRDAANWVVTSDVAVTVAQTAAAVVVTPGAVSLPPGTPQPFAASLRDQFGDAMAEQPIFAWSVSGAAGGSVSAEGVYTPGVGGGTATVRATAPGGGENPLFGEAAVTIDPGPQYPNGFGGAAGAGMSFGGTGKIVNGRLRITEPGPVWSGGAFHTIKAGVGQFVTEFDVQLTDAVADGFAFVIQNQAPNVAGWAGGALGYGGITNSVAVKFPILGGMGTGLWTGGDPSGPTTPLPVELDMKNGHVFKVRVTYDGTTLKVTETDTVTGATATQSYAVDIAAAVGGTTAWFGFTGGIAGAQATQEILAWTYAAVAPDNVPPTVTAGAFKYDAHPHKVTVTFSEDVSGTLSASDLKVKLVGGAETEYTPTSVAYDALTNTATFTLAGELPNGDYTATIAAGAVADGAGNALAADYTLPLFAMAGDANRDRAVNFDDLLVLAQNYNQLAGRTWGQGDFTGDGAVDFDDLLKLAQNYNETLDGAPAAAVQGADVAALAAVMSPAKTTVTPTKPTAKKATPVASPEKAEVRAASKPMKPVTPKKAVFGMRRI